MQIIAGLGNPGEKYARYRHNVGFMAADAIARHHGFPPYRQKFSALVTEGSIDGEKVLLMKPQSFMNRSGPPIAEAANFYKVPLDKVVVIHDEIDFPAGKVRIKLGGSTAGHNGLRSIDQSLGMGYRRLRLGIGHPGQKERVVGHVLGPFSEADMVWLKPLLDAIAEHFGLLLAGQDSSFLNKLITANLPALGAPAAGRPDGTRDKSKAKPAGDATPPTQPPAEGPLAAMLRRLFHRS